jgi:hypothetical protein
MSLRAANANLRFDETGFRKSGRLRRTPGSVIYFFTPVNLAKMP